MESTLCVHKGLSLGLFWQVDGRQADLDEAVHLQEALLLQVFTCFRDILCEGHAGLGASEVPSEAVHADGSEPPATGVPMCQMPLL